ncbi:tuberoinfundibular peptide of 39 residues [Esox lucius]|uniref:Tuberoinfundibular peptide of 39 residues n=1 Tax=Esox lucius TaxID=8010 RepID=A0A3P9ANN7_ESOLU|nr:tuberoinfundibular peptide of 39 residues [Esox lucius]
MAENLSNLKTETHGKRRFLTIKNGRQGATHHQTRAFTVALRMADLAPPPNSRPALLLVTLMAMTLVTSGYPQPHFRPVHRGSSPGDPGDSDEREDWEVLYPSISLRNWNMQMMSAPDFGAAKSKEDLLGEQWLPMVGQLQMDENMEKDWLGDWAPQDSNNEEKRNIVVADDAAFREKSKLLTAMERQKWLNSYMQKLLVVNSQ